MKALERLYYGYYQLQVRVGNRSVAKPAAIILLTYLLIINFITIWMYALVFLPSRASLVESVPYIIGLIIVVLVFFIKNKRYAKIIEHSSMQVNGNRLLIAAWTHLIFTLALLFFGFYLFYLKNNGRLLL